MDRIETIIFYTATALVGLSLSILALMPILGWFMSLGWAASITAGCVLVTVACWPATRMQRIDRDARRDARRTLHIRHDIDGRLNLLEARSERWASLADRVTATAERTAFRFKEVERSADDNSASISSLYRQMDTIRSTAALNRSSIDALERGRDTDTANTNDAHRRLNQHWSDIETMKSALRSVLVFEGLWSGAPDHIREVLGEMDRRDTDGVNSDPQAGRCEMDPNW